MKIIFYLVCDFYQQENENKDSEADDEYFEKLSYNVSVKNLQSGFGPYSFINRLILRGVIGATSRFSIDTWLCVGYLLL